MLRHERQTVAMELAAALHHSRDGGLGTSEGLRAQKTASSGGRPGVLTGPKPQLVDAVLSYRAASAPLLAPPSLAAVPDDDEIARGFLEETALKSPEQVERMRRVEKERKRKEEEKEMQDMFARRTVPHPPRLRGKRKKGRRRRSFRRLLRAPLVAALVVDSGSGTLALLVFLVTFFFALCSLRLSSGLRCSASWPFCTRRTVARLSSILAVACAGLVLLVTMHLAFLFPFGVRTVAVAFTWLVLLVTMHLALCSLPWFAGPFLDPMVQTVQNLVEFPQVQFWDEVVFMPVVGQRLALMVQTRTLWSSHRYSRLPCCGAEANPRGLVDHGDYTVAAH